MVGDGFKLYFSDGFFAGRSQTLDSILLCGWMCCEHYNVMWIAIQFVYRYTVVCLQQKYVLSFLHTDVNNRSDELAVKKRRSVYFVKWQPWPSLGGPSERGSSSS